MRKSIELLNPYLFKDCVSDTFKFAKTAFCKGGGGGSNKEYERQLREQREAREKAEREAAELKRNQEATTAERERRAKSSFLTGGEGAGDEEFKTRKTYLGSGT